jgi:hypothetical protein
MRMGPGRVRGLQVRVDVDHDETTLVSWRGAGGDGDRRDGTHALRTAEQLGLAGSRRRRNCLD